MISRLTKCEEQMGEAKRRRAEIEALKEERRKWDQSLSPETRALSHLAIRVYEEIVIGLRMTMGCYHLSFFMQEYARRQYGIATKVVVGWINDGEWEGAASHAWLEYNCKKIDVTLIATSNPESQPAGDLIVLDHIEIKGMTQYSYWGGSSSERSGRFGANGEGESEHDSLRARGAQENAQICRRTRGRCEISQ
jgi:hypothetical protein